MKPRNCRNCHFMKVPEGERIYRDRMYECTYLIDPLPKLPDSVTKRYGFNETRLLEKRRMQPEDGSECPTFVRR